mgnify:CR=1 FL=1
MLHMRFTHGDFGGVASRYPSRIRVMVKAGPVEAWADRLLDTSVDFRWNVEGHIPIANTSDLLEIRLYDGEAATQKPIGKALMRIHTLADGHLSRDNALTFDGAGGRLFITIHMGKWAESSCGTGGSGGAGASSAWAWQQYNHESFGSSAEGRKFLEAYPWWRGDAAASGYEAGSQYYRLSSGGHGAGAGSGAGFRGGVPTSAAGGAGVGGGAAGSSSAAAARRV